MLYELYMNKENRDKRLKELKAEGKRKYKKSSSRNQLLHPMHLEDFEGPEKYDAGIGNNVYKTFFSAVYKIEEVA
jgi:hypothetical protein